MEEGQPRKRYMTLAFDCMCHMRHLMLTIYPLPQLENLPTMVQGVWSDDHKVQLENTTHFRKLLSIGAPRPRRSSPSPVMQFASFRQM